MTHDSYQPQTIVSGLGETASCTQHDAREPAVLHPSASLHTPKVLRSLQEMKQSKHAPQTDRERCKALIFLQRRCEFLECQLAQASSQVPCLQRQQQLGTVYSANKVTDSRLQAMVSLDLLERTKRDAWAQTPCGAATLCPTPCRLSQSQIV